MGKRLDSFTDFALLTDQHLFSDPETIINDASAYRTYTYFEAWKRKKEIQGGNGVKDFIELTKDNTGEWVASNHKFDPQSSDGTREHSVNWAEYANHLFWEADEEACNDGDREAKYKALYKSKRIRRSQNTIDDLEASLWASPSAIMELATGVTTTATDVARLPYSIPSLITCDGLHPSAFSGSTVMQINPATYTNWKNHNTRLNSFATEIEDALFDMYYKCDFQTAGSPADGVMTGTPKDGVVMYADLASIKALRRIMRDANDRLTNLGQYDNKLTYMGRPFVWAEPLGDQTTTEANQTIYGINWNFLYPIVRQGYFMTLMKNPQGGGAWILPLQPKARVLYEFTCVNLWCSSRRRHFRISKTGATS
jgi:hypothetical protein